MPALLVWAVPSMAQVPLFDSLVAYPLKERISSFQVKDITGDGIKDVLVMYPALQEYFGILAGMRNGSYGTEQIHAKPVNYGRSSIADFNKDGWPDLVLSSYWDNGIRVYYGDPSGQFNTGTYFATGVHGREVVCADINNDGYDDIVTTTSGSGQKISLHVFINKGDGTFHPQQSYPSVLDTCRELFLTDKNKDGLLDIVVSSSFPWVLFYYQQPDGSFVARYRPTYTTARVAIADVNNDNKEDLLLLYASFDNMPGSDSIVVLLNTVDTAYAPAYKIPQFASNKLRPTDLRLADINRDGYQDMVMNQLDLDGAYDDTVFYMTGRPDGTFNQPVAIPLPANVQTIRLADIDNDGYPDLLAACEDNKLYTVFNRKGQGQSPAAQLLVFPNPATHKVFLQGLPEGRHRITLYAASGLLIQSWMNAAPQWSAPIAHLPAGTYHLRIQSASKKITLAFRKF